MMATAAALILLTTASTAARATMPILLATAHSAIPHAKHARDPVSPTA